MTTYRPAAAGIIDKPEPRRETLAGVLASTRPVLTALDKLLSDQSLSRTDRREAMREIAATAQRMERVLEQCIAAEQEGAFV